MQFVGKHRLLQATLWPSRILSNTRVILEYIEPLVPLARRVLPRRLIDAWPPIAAVTVPRVPIRADAFRFLNGRRCRLGPNHVGALPALEDLHGQAEGRVERDVAVHQPGARVVGLEGDDDEAVVGEQDNVAPRRVNERELELCGIVRLIFSLLEDGKVMAVEMDLCHVKSAADPRGYLFYLQDARRM